MKTAKRNNPTLAEDLIEALGEAVAHAEGRLDLPTRTYAPPTVDVRAIRKRFALSRTKFATRFGLDPRAVQDWEQGRRAPDRTARILLLVIEAQPGVVEGVLKDNLAA